MGIAIPSNIEFGTFTARFVQALADATTDIDHNPDLLPMGGKVTFIPNVPILKVESSADPLIIISKPTVALIDSLGYLVDSTGRRGVDLIATDSDTNPSGWGWNITIDLTGMGGVIELTDVELPGASIVDLTQAVTLDDAPVTPSSDALIAANINREGSFSRQAVLALVPTGGDGGGTGGGVTSVNGRVGKVTDLAEQADVIALATSQQQLAPKVSPTFSGTSSFTGTVTIQAPVAQNHPATKKYVDDLISSISGGNGVVTPDATTGIKGKLALAGMLGGTADAPTVPVLLNGTAAQYFRGDRTWQTLNVSAIDGLSTAINGREAAIVAGTASQYYRGDKTWQNVSSLPITQAATDADTAVFNSVDGGRGPAATGVTWTGSVVLTEPQIKGSRNITITGATTLTLPTMSSSRDAAVTLYITQGTGGSKLITWPSGIKWSEGAKPTLSTVAGSIDVITLLWSGTTWVGILGAKAIA